MYLFKISTKTVGATLALILTAEKSGLMLYACGSNGKGQLGLGDQEDRDSWCQVPLNLEGKLLIAGGGNHTVLLEQRSGKVFVTQNDLFVPVEHPNGGVWKLVSAGWDFCVFVDSKNRVWQSKGVYTSPTLIETDIGSDSVVKIDSGLAHTVFLTSSGALYGWGASRRGQAGRETPNLDVPTRFDCGRARSFGCGKDFTAVVQVHGELNILGNRRWLADVPKHCPESSEVQCGWSSLAITGVGIFGNNSHGQLSMPSNYVQFALGSEHGVLLTREGLVETWGWGEHGNCPGPNRFGGTVEVFAGCATSFVNTYGI